MLHYLSVDTVMMTVLGYPMSWVEFVGTVFNLWCVWLVAKNRVLNWPVGLVGVVIFGIMFWQIRLYADLLEQAYFFVTGIIGWWAWTHPRVGADDRGELAMRRLTRREIGLTLGAVAVATAGTAWAMARLHLWLPAVFPEAASYPLLDSLTTVMSFAAQALLVRRILENWVLWIAVDIIGIGLYWAKDVRLVSILYAVFLCLAVTGLIRWLREHHARTATVQHT